MRETGSDGWGYAIPGVVQIMSASFRCVLKAQYANERSQGRHAPAGIAAEGWERDGLVLQNDPCDKRLAILHRNLVTTEGWNGRGHCAAAMHTAAERTGSGSGAICSAGEPRTLCHAAYRGQQLKPLWWWKMRPKRLTSVER